MYPPFSAFSLHVDIIMYIYLCSTDSAGTHPSNQPYDFTIDLPQTLRLEGKWECALMEIHFSKENLHEDLLIMTDIVENSYIKDIQLPVLRVVQRSTVVSNPYYFPVSRDTVSHLQIYIRTDSMKVPSFDDKPLTCTLHFQPI